ncbi:hypothetical protein RJ641_000954 [Dillenia turbinata]|uniref:RING-type domain-containing protein n=1 Tax=Dillenia turbinata TaxID=194707 RepID=A0AAN8WEW1_9MAGN
MATPTAMNQFSMPDSQPLQLIDLSQLHNHQTPNVVSTGLRLSFADQLHQQQHQNLMPHSSSSSSSSSPSFFFSEDLASQIKQQRDEIDQFLQAQGEQLRRTIAEKRQRHYRALLSAAEEMVARKLREKEADVEKAARRNAELEAKAAQLSVEAQVWQAKARAQEATAASLQAQLQQAIMSGGCAPAQDQEGGGLGLRCAGSGRENQAEDAESAYIDPERVEPVGPVCKACRRRAASVVLLPCRHLCLCTECDAVAQACPLCLSHRNASVEVFLC